MSSRTERSSRGEARDEAKPDCAAGEFMIGVRVEKREARAAAAFFCTAKRARSARGARTFLSAGRSMASATSEAWQWAQRAPCGRVWWAADKNVRAPALGARGARTFLSAGRSMASATSEARQRAQRAPCGRVWWAADKNVRAPALGAHGARTFLSAGRSMAPAISEARAADRNVRAPVLVEDAKVIL